MQELRDRVIAGKVKPISPGTYSPELVGLMHGLLTLTPARRPTLTAILTMPQARISFSCRCPDIACAVMLDTTHRCSTHIVFSQFALHS